MKAAVLHAPRTPFVVEDLVLDPPRSGEVLVRIAAAGVCHSDWHFVSGDLTTPLPAVLGHEGAGVVEEVGPDVTRVKQGDHVVLLWRAGCGRCDYCSIGKPALCSASRGMRANGTLADGTSRLRGRSGEVKHFLGVSCFAERAVVPEMSLLPIGVEVPLDIAAVVGCAVMTGVGAVINTAALRPGTSALIVGAGGVGLSAVMGARLAGADPIIVVDLVTKKLELAQELGATNVLDGRGDLVASVRELTGEGVDFAFECIGNSALLAQAVKALRRGGTAVAVGLPRADAEVSLNVVELVTQEKSLKGSIYGSTRHFADIPRLISLYRRGRLPIDRLLARRYRLTEINDAYQALLNGEFARAVIVPN
ncbi:MAG: Zn-dependent alcohol dehydrogenase [Chloroflexi bacterium]|nr:MAG: Zn-dependent alcohol dehydrogenase [Chloroflexota bacterium]